MEKRVRLIRSGRRHRVSLHRIIEAMNDSGEPQRIPSTDPAKADRLIWIGRDDRGELLEVFGFETDDGIVVFHAMPVKYYDRRPR